MQGLPPEARKHLPEGGIRTLWQAQPPAIDRIPQYRKMLVGHVHADLVSAAGFQLHAYQRMRPKTFLYPIMRHGFLAIGNDRHALAIDRMPPDGCLNTATGSEHAVDDRQVFTLYSARLQCLDQPFMRRQVARHYHQATGIFVEPVHDSRPGQAGQ